MLESLRRAIDEIFGSVIKPIKDWILRQSWAVQLLCLILISLAAYAFWQPQSVRARANEATLMWRAWRTPDSKVPLGTSARKSLGTAIARLSESVETDLPSDLAKSTQTPWSASQSVLALAAVDIAPPDPAGFVRFVRAGQRDNCFCWTELPEQARTEAAGFISGWTAAAFARVGEPLAPADLDYLLAAQGAGGAWPMFPETGARRFGSTYSTAWIAYGLHLQRAAGLIPPDRRAAVDRAIRRAGSALLRARGDGARWPAHLGGAEHDMSESASGMILFVLHEIGAPDLDDVDSAWLDALPDEELEPDSVENHYIGLYSDGPTAIDHFVQVRLPWILLGTVRAYPSGSVGQRAKALRWIERTLNDPKVRAADTGANSWVRAELLLGLAETRRLL